MMQPLMQIGVGGLFALLIVREVLGFFLKIKGMQGIESPTGSGIISPDPALALVMAKQIDILVRIEEKTGETYKMALRAEIVSEGVVKSLEALRLSSHATVQTLQTILDRLPRQP